MNNIIHTNSLFSDIICKNICHSLIIWRLQRLHLWILYIHQLDNKFSYLVCNWIQKSSKRRVRTHLHPTLKWLLFGACIICICQQISTGQKFVAKPFSPETHLANLWQRRAQIYKLQQLSPTTQLSRTLIIKHKH